MDVPRLRKALAYGAFVFTAVATPAQDSSTLTMRFGDLAAIRLKAESVDSAAQVTLASSLASRFRATEALAWYRKAAAQGDVEGQYYIGKFLLFGAVGIPADQKVQAIPAEGVRWTFIAATNSYPYAYQNMAHAYQQGLGVNTNLVTAYAWLKLFSETQSGLIVGRVEMNEFALKLNAADLQRAQALASNFKAGKWQAPVTRAIPEGDNRLKLNGITFGSKTPLAVINGKTLSEGESIKIDTRPGSLNIKCLKIKKDSVLVSIQGEEKPRLLWMK